MRTLVAVACLIAAVMPAAADDGGAKPMSCHGVYRAMAMLADQGKYAAGASANAAAKARFAAAADSAEEIARNDYVVAKKTSKIDQDLAAAEQDYETGFSDLTGKDGAYNRAKMDDLIKRCDPLLTPQ